MRILAPLLLAACVNGAGPSPSEEPPEPTPPGELSPTVQFLTPTQHLTRASLALRGVRPSIEDLRAVDADPAALPGIVDRYLDTPEFGETIKDLHNETLLLRIEQLRLTMPPSPSLPADVTATEMNTSVFEEPLRLIEDIVMTDQPYTKIVTADYTMTNGLGAQIWGYEHTGPADQWQRTSWTDGRGAAGVLATEALYHRWRSAGANFNRGRANVISRGLLCHDFLHADIAVDTSIDLSDPDVVANAVVANPSCAGCHQTLDPLASYLFVFAKTLPLVGVVQGREDYPIGGYLADQEDRWRTTNKRPPLFFGQQANGLTGLGRAIADDPRFARCTAARFASYLTEVPRDQLSGRWIARLQTELVDSSWSAKQLAKSVVLSDEFRASHDTDDEAAEHLVGLQKLRPDQLMRMLRDLTGFRWTTPTNTILRRMPYGSPELLQSDVLGFRVLGGGIDGYYVTEPVHTINATSSLVAKAAASAYASYVVDQDAAAPAAERTLFVEAGVGATDPDRIRAQLVHLHARIYGELVAPDAEEVDETFALFDEALAATGDRARAWKLTLVGMLTDARALYY